MKRILALILLLCLLISAAACAPSDEDTSSAPSQASDSSSKYVHTVDVMQYVSAGNIPELPITLGDYMNQVKAEYGYSETQPEATPSYTDEEAMEFYNHKESFGMMLDEGYLQVTATTGDAYYMYKTRYEGYGISKIACTIDCFGFKNGITFKSDVMDSIDMEPVVTENIEKIDFLPGTVQNCTSLSYTTGDYTVTFYFIDDFLSVTTIQDNRYWYEYDEE